MLHMLYALFEPTQRVPRTCILLQRGVSSTDLLCLIHSNNSVAFLLKASDLLVIKDLL